MTNIVWFTTEELMRTPFVMFLSGSTVTAPYGVHAYFAYGSSSWLLIVKMRMFDAAVFFVFLLKFLFFEIKKFEKP